MASAGLAGEGDVLELGQRAQQLHVHEDVLVVHGQTLHTGADVRASQQPLPGVAPQGQQGAGRTYGAVTRWRLRLCIFVLSIFVVPYKTRWLQ